MSLELDNRELMLLARCDGGSDFFPPIAGDECEEEDEEPSVGC